MWCPTQCNNRGIPQTETWFNVCQCSLSTQSYYTNSTYVSISEMCKYFFSDTQLFTIQFRHEP